MPDFFANFANFDNGLSYLNIQIYYKVYLLTVSRYHQNEKLILSSFVYDLCDTYSKNVIYYRLG